MCLGQMNGIQTAEMAEQWIYASFMAARPHLTDTLDENVRRPEWTRYLLDQCDSPDGSAVNVTVTGSKGKGSTSVMLAAMLRAYGYKVGLFTSPHLVHFTERIRVNGVKIPDACFVRLANKVKEVAVPLQKELRLNEYISPIGLTAVIAALYFQEQGTDINIWECGRGARYDDVNQITHQAAVITPIMTEHTKQLGARLEDVAKHKFAVITPAVRTVCIGWQHECVQQLVQQRDRIWQGREVVCLGRDFHVTDVQLYEEGTQFSVYTPEAFFENVHVPLLGAFQAENAAVAFAASEQVNRLWQANNRSRGGGQPASVALDITVARKALGCVQWPGRLERLMKQPTVIVDGSIHRHSARHVVDTLPHLNKNTGVLIVGIPQDKDYVGVMQVLAPLARKVIVTSAKRDYPHIAADVVDVAKQFCTQVQFKRQSESAFRNALSEVAADEWLLIVGTQSLVGEAQTFFKGAADSVAF